MSENSSKNQCQEKRGRCEFLNIIAWLTLILQSNRAEPSVSPISFKIETVTFCWDAPAGPTDTDRATVRAQVAEATGGIGDKVCLCGRTANSLDIPEPKGKLATSALE